MRILLTETADGDSAAIERAARERGVEVVSCQPARGSATPCVGFTGAAPCPLDRHVDAVIGVHRGGDQWLSGREFGLACAVRAGLPIVMVGDNPLGTAAVQATEADAVDAAVGLARRGAGRPAVPEIMRQARKVLEELGARHVVTWAGYVDRADGFDVVVEVSHALTVFTQERLDLALISMFWQAIRDNRFGRIVYELRTRTS